ncbi:MAG: tripartite tricarboxylate transporter substrate binding protein, partial [Betaproteobacteria bacterium]
MLRSFISVLILLALAPGAGAQSYPAKPIRLIVPYVAGGDTDIVARLITPKLSEALGQQVVVDNRPGAGSLIGTEALLRAPADGYTLAMGTISSLAVLPVTKSNVPYDPIKDVAPIVLVTTVPYVLVVHPSVPARSVADLVKLAKSRPGELSYETPGIATGIHLTAEYLSSVAGIKLVHVPYKGGAPSVIDLVAGNISMVFSTFSTTGQHLKSGRLRGLAVASSARAKDFPAVPTMSESGYRDFEASTWHGVVARSGTPKPLITRLNAEIVRIVNTDDVRSALLNAGFDIAVGPVEDFERFVRSEIDK